MRCKKETGLMKKNTKTVDWQQEEGLVIGLGRQEQPVVRARRRQRDSAGSPRAHDESGATGLVRCGWETGVGSDGSGKPFTVGQPVIGGNRAQSDSGRPTGVAA